MNNKKKLTNAEVFADIAKLSAAESNQYGVTAEMKEAAAKIAAGDTSVRSSFWQPYTALYNAFTGFIVKFALQDLSKAYYTDVYSRHHRNMIQGRPELGFVKQAKAGTGNPSQQFGDQPAIGSLTTVTTAEAPDVVALYDVSIHSYVARIPISPEDVKTAMLTEYGVNDYFTKIREAMEDKIIEDRNQTYDAAFTSLVTSGLIAAGTGSEIAANAAKATYVEVAPADWSTVLTSRRFDLLTEEQLTQVFIAIKRTFYDTIGRPITDYNALGELNNAPRDVMVCYVDSGLYAELSRVKASVFNASELESDGLRIEPLRAPWLGVVINDKPILAAVGSADFIRDYPTEDYAKTVPTDSGEIITRRMTTQLAICGYEPFCVLVGAISEAPVGGFSITESYTEDDQTAGNAGISLIKADGSVVTNFSTPIENVQYIALSRPAFGSYTFSVTIDDTSTTYTPEAMLTLIPLTVDVAQVSVTASES